MTPLLQRGKKINVSGTASINVDAKACSDRERCVPMTDPSLVNLQRSSEETDEAPAEDAMETFTVFPVPAQDHLTIAPKTLAEGNYILSLYSSSGQLKKQQQVYFAKANVPLAVNELPPGIYILQLTSPKGETSNKKIIVQ